MSFYITNSGDYYEGDMASADHVEVEQRPTPAHIYEGGAWVINKDKFNAVINSQIASMEFKEILPRATRDFMILSTLEKAKTMPWAAGMTDIQVAGELLNEAGDNFMPSFSRMWFFEQQIALLRRSRMG